MKGLQARHEGLGRGKVGLDEGDLTHYQYCLPDPSVSGFDTLEPVRRTHETRRVTS